MTKNRRLEKSYGDERTPEQRRIMQECQREDEEFNRHKNTVLRFWRDCPVKACRRQKRCAGNDPHVCFRTNWDKMPEETKMLVRAVIKARMAGHPPQEALRVAKDDVLRQLIEQQRLVERMAELRGAPVRPAPYVSPASVSPASAPPAPRGPRMRPL